MFMALWTVANFMQWILHNAEWNLLFVRITSILSGFITIFFVYFSYGLVRVKINLKKKLLFLVPYLGIIALIFLKRDLQFFNMTDCEYAMDGFFMLYDYLFEIAYVSWATYIMIKNRNNSNCNILVPFQIKILISAIWFFTLWNIFYEEIGRRNILVEKYSEIDPYFIIGNLFFVSLIAFAIIRKELFEFPIVITNHYTVVVWTLIFLGFIFFYYNLTLIILAVIFYIILMYIFWKM
jgi:hypothetical protein